MKNTIALLLFLFGVMVLLPAQVLTGSEANQEVPNAQKVWIKENRLAPTYVLYEDQKRIPFEEFYTYFGEVFVPPHSGYSLVSKPGEPDQLGHIHYRHTQLYMEIPVEGSMVNVHTENDKVYSYNGDMYDVGTPNMVVSIEEKDALQAAIDFTGATTYQWELDPKKSLMFGLHDQQKKEESALSKGELVIVPVEGDYESGAYRLAWKFDIFAAEPLSRTYTFVDAERGTVIHQLDRIHTADTVGTAMTSYSGTQSIVTDLKSNGQFRLQESGRGNGIITLNMQNGTAYNNAVEFLDDDNTWNNVNAQQNEVATDAHWGAEMTYDYFLQKHGRNSIDGNGFTLRSFVHYSTGYQNAFWTGSRMVYGDGSPGGVLPAPLTVLDICGHEISHGLTNFSARLIYRNESGALNESFSDIFGKCVEKFARPNNFSWRIGGDLGTGIRDMANPSLFSNPRNYLGTAWFTGTGDNGGVHYNSGVQNHWFYLLTEGGSGTNDFGDQYTVNPMGFDTASAIAFRNLTVYLTPNSNYTDARFFSIQSTIDLYGPCTDEYANVVNAWYAVGIGKETSVIPISNFSAVDSTICNLPYEISFSDKALGASSYHWDFGDGSTSTNPSPTHTFPGPGTYTVTLNITGACGGADTLIKPSFITIQPPPATPVGTDETTTCQGQAMLIASGTDRIEWRNGAGIPLAAGDTFFTPPLTQTTSYFAYNVTTAGSQQVGALDSTIGGGGFYNSDPRYLVFDVIREQVLEAVTMYASFDGYRLIEYRDNTGTVIDSRSVFLSKGKNRANLGFILKRGNDQQLAVKGLVGLYGNNSGMLYPYDLPGKVSIKGTNHWNPTNLYLFFYDWEVHDLSCRSYPKEIIVSVDPSGMAPTVSDETRCGPGSVTFTATAFDSTVNWYDILGNLVAIGSSFTTPSLNTTTAYFAENAQYPAPQKVGPADKSVGISNYFRNFFDTHLTFQALQPVTVKSIWVDADMAGMRSIILSDGAGVPLDTFDVMLTAGPSRVTLNRDLPAGEYRMGGIDLGLSRTTSNLQYPYSLDGVFEITGSSNGAGTYFYFYDFEIQEKPCLSSQVPVTANILPGTAPVPSFSYTNSFSNYNFTDQSTGATSWFWDFGDGSTSTLQNPSHAFGVGTFVVVLTISNGTCEESVTETIVNQFGVGVEPEWVSSWSVFPNPGSGTFRVEVEADGVRSIQVSVFNTLGQEVYASDLTQTVALRETIDLSQFPSGTYLIRLRADDQVLIKKYILSR